MDGEPLPSTAAVVLAGAPGLPPPVAPELESDDDDSGDDADDALLPPGPVDPERCTVSALECSASPAAPLSYPMKMQPCHDAALPPTRRSRGRATPEARLSPLCPSSSPSKTRPASASGKAVLISTCVCTHCACCAGFSLHSTA